MKIVENKKLEFLIIIINLVFLTYYVILAVFSRPHYDDLHFLWKLREMSIYEYVMDMYYSRSGRFIAYAINGIVFKTINILDAHWFFPIVFWFIGVGLSIYSLCKLARIKLSFFVASIVALFYNIFVLTNIDFAVFNWLCALSYYILVPAMLALLALLLSNKKSIIEYIAIVVISIFLGGGQESFTPIVLAVLFSIMFFHLYKNNYNIGETLKSYIVIKLISSVIIMLVLFAIVIIAPGNYNRLGMDEFSTPKSILEYISGFINAITMFMYYIVFYVPYYFVLALIIFKQTHNKYNSCKLIQKDYFIASVVIFAVYMTLAVIPSVYLWGGFGIQRNYTHLVFVTMLFIIYWLQFLFFKLIKINQKAINFSTLLGTLILLGIMTINIFIDTKSAKKYAIDVDKRIDLVLHYNKSGSTKNLALDTLSVPYTIDVKYILFKALGKKSNPNPVLYYISDTSDNPNEYAYHFRKYYKLNFDIVIKK